MQEILLFFVTNYLNICYHLFNCDSSIYAHHHLVCSTTNDILI